jgi:biopolymer transport protein ExbD
MRSEKAFDTLNMVPFIDIMLVLLAIVLTTSSFIASGKIPINLPQATQEEIDASKTYTVEIDAKGGVFYEGASCTLAQLETSLNALDKTAPVLIRADKTVELQAFIDVADLLKRLGFGKVAVQVEHKQ